MLQASKQFPQQLCIVDHELRFLSTMKKARELAQEKCGGIFFFEAYMQTGSRLPPKVSHSQLLIIRNGIGGIQRNLGVASWVQRVLT